jgi:polyphosphate kinase
MSREILELQVVPELEKNGIYLYMAEEEMSQQHREQVLHIFMSKVLSYL